MAVSTKLTDTHVSFFSVAPNRTQMALFERADIQNILISYHYIRKDLNYTKEILEMIRNRGGLFMTDSGAFSMFNDPDFDGKTFDWDTYLLEYTDWLMANREYVFVACNLDVDQFVGHEKVKQWNRQYFKPLEEYMNIAYVAHGMSKNATDMMMVKEYCKEHDYVAVSEAYAPVASDIYQMAKQTKTTIHGLAWTKPTILKDYPFFSVDSTSWVNYQKFGATPSWDGTNFTIYDKDNKAARKMMRKQCEKWQVGFEEFCTEKNPDGTHNDTEGLVHSLLTWNEVLGFIRQKSKLKLKTTIADLLDGKLTVFKPRKDGISGALALVESGGLEVAETSGNANNNYVETEGGGEVAVYKRREDVQITPVQFRELMGSGGMFCSNCYIADKCPMFRPSTSCAFKFAPDHNAKTPIEMLDGLIAQQEERVQRALFFEQMEGGTPNKTYSAELALLSRFNQMKADMIIRMNTSGTTMTVQVTTSSTNGGTPGAAGGVMGALAALMGGGGAAGPPLEIGN